MHINLSKHWRIVGAPIVLAALALALVGCPAKEPSPSTSSSSTGSTTGTASVQAVNLGISPYPDTGLPIVTRDQGLFEKNGVKADLKVLQWGEVMPALASGAVDVVIQNMTSFQETYDNLKEKDTELVFARPLFVFRGGALLVRGGSGMKSLDDELKASPDRATALKKAILQLRGKTIICPNGTDHEQMVLAALKLAGLAPDRDVKIRHAELDDGVAAFVGGEADACTGGLVQRLAVEKRGGFVLFEMDDVIPPVINGLITTKKYAEAHGDVIDGLEKSWFATVQYIGADPKANSKAFLDFLSQQGSAKFTPEQYVNVFKKGDVFPTTPDEAKKLFEDPASKYYWKNAWDAVGKFLVETKKIKAAAPDEAYATH